MVDRNIYHNGMNMHKCKLLTQYIQSPTQAHDVILAWCMEKNQL